MRFVDYLKAYVDNHAAELVDKSLYLLRNKSKVGMGFFEAGNFTLITSSGLIRPKRSTFRLSIRRA